MNRRLHSIPATLWIKWVFPWLWIGAFLFGNVLIIAQLIGLLPLQGNLGSLYCASCGLAVATLLGGCFLIALANELKHVTLTETYVLIGGFYTTVRIDLREIVSVEETNILNVVTIEIRFEHETAFGKSIQFVPAGFLFYLGPAPSPIEDLRHAAARARCLHLDQEDIVIPTPISQEGIKGL